MRIIEHHIESPSGRIWGSLALHYPSFCIPDDLHARFASAADVPETFFSLSMDVGARFATDALGLDAYAAIGAYDRDVLITHGSEDPPVGLAYSQRATRRPATPRHPSAPPTDLTNSPQLGGAITSPGAIKHPTERGPMDIKDVKRVTIAGCGTEGSQIASMVAYKGFETTVWLRSEGSIERARPRLASVKKQIVGVLEAWKTDPSAYCRGLSDERDVAPEQIDELIAQAEERLPKIHLTTSLEEAFGEADVVIECINEDPAQKTDLYEKIAPVMPEHTVLLTDSSTFLPSTFADATGRPDRYLTLHFANQIWRNNLTELMRHDRTSDESFALAEQFSHAIGMIPLKLNKEQPGYILNTLLIPWFRAALQLVATGVSDPATVDLCWELDTGATKDQTPFRKLDKVGLPLAMHIMGMQPGADDSATVNGQIVALLKGYVEAGKTGIAVGEGFYRYDENGNVIE